jgi:uncharacterized membrane-anchored protein YhcB (DUF1043 family)
VYSTNTVLIAIFVALLAGAALGALLNRRLSPDNKKHRELESKLEQVLQEQKEYQHEVVEHFSDTGKLLGNLAESYRDVHNHLANGATKLSGNHLVTDLEPLPEASLEKLEASPVPEDLQQPLDYAPKSSPHETGMLNEEFGLDKKAAETDSQTDPETKSESVSEPESEPTTPERA